MRGRGDHSTKRWGQCASRYEKFIDYFLRKGEGNIWDQYYTEIKKRLPVRRLPTIYLHYTWLCETSICKLKAFCFLCVWRSHMVTQFDTKVVYLFVGCHPHCVLCSCECVCFCMVEIFWRTNVFIGVKEYACIIIACKREEEWKLVMFIYICSTSRLFTNVPDDLM